MIRIRASLAAVVIVAIALCAPLTSATAQLSDSTRARIDAVFARYDHTDSPGCALGISEHGRELYTRAYGMSDFQHGQAIAPSSIFHFASISKQFAAFSIALLADDSRLSVDDSVRKYIPELPDYGTRITVRQLMHHTSGLRDQWQLLKYAGWRDDDLITEDDVLGIVSRQKTLNFKPGDEWLYSNTGFTLLAVIVKRVSGKSLHDFAQALADFAGSYYSEELDVTYTLSVTDSGLVAKHRKLATMRLDPAVADVFTLDNRATAIFSRDRARKVESFTLTDGRVRGIRFSRVN